MSTWLSIFGFELRYYLSRVSTHVYFGIFFLIGLIQIAGMGGLFPGVPATGFGNPNTHIDSPIALGMLSIVLSLFATMVVAAVAGHSAQRDFGEHMHPLVFTTPIPKTSLLSARFVAAWLVSMYACFGAAAGMSFGLLLPVDADFTGSFTLTSIIVPYALYIGPNVFLVAALFFSIAGITRKMFPNYIGGIGLLIGYLVASELTSDLDNKTLASLIDPFGLETLSQMTRYWTPVEQNALQLFPDALVLANRGIWLAVAAATLALGFYGIRFAETGWQPLSRFRKAPSETAEPALAADAVVVPPASRQFGSSAALAQYRVLTARALREVLGNRYFAAIVGGGVLLLLVNAWNIGSVYGTTTWPVTYVVINGLTGAFGLFTIIVITFYAGDLVWRERDLKVAEVVDAMPMPTWVSLAAKVTALIAVVFAMQTIILVVGVLTQLSSGYTHFEIGLHLTELYGLEMLEWIPLALLAIAIHTVVNHKYVAHFFVILFFVGRGFRGLMGFEHNLPWFGSSPGLVYSDMNGWGSFLYGHLVFKAYWMAWALVLLTLSFLLVVRGSEASPAVRLRELKRRLTPTGIGALAGFTAAAVGLGAFIFYNTNIVNEYQLAEAGKDDAATYEKRYKADWDGANQPRILAVDLAVDLFPSTGSVAASGELTLVNQHDSPIDTLFIERLAGKHIEVVNLDPGMPVANVTVDEDFGVHLFELAEPMAPGQQATLRFEARRSTPGFRNSGAETTIVGNGSFINSGMIVPVLGYSRGGELSDKYDRLARELPERERMADLDDPEATQNNYISSDADWIDFRAVVSTESDQTAIAPGYLLKEWEDGGRRYFEYEMDAKILHFTSFLSARYAVTKGDWNGLPIEIYHHPEHDRNVDRMIESVQHSLDYYTKHYGPYQHRQVRILEFPRYASFAQSFPNTIPYSESIGFIAKVDDPDEDVDYVYNVTAHEIAHQWWAHQIVGGSQQGATVLSESLSEYSALMVMQERHGEAHIRRYLEYSLDGYLRGRAGEREKELPLLRVENQGYIHYQKGALALYLLQDELGEEVVNGALSRLLDRTRFSGPPYPTSRDLVAELTAVTPPELSYLIDDLFEHITLYDNRAESATWVKTEDGRYAVTLELQAKKLRVDEDGSESPIAMADRVEVGVFIGDRDHPEPLYLAKHIIGDSTKSVTVLVDEEPLFAGIDPWHKLIDRDSDDNLVNASEGEGAAPSADAPAPAIAAVVLDEPEEDAQVEGEPAEDTAAP
ncbi:MAG: hypothetical protein KC912_25475 [Proteobacteria bacterium]|nr:hypothetical protein [Pseudomonadota bacterium]